MPPLDIVAHVQGVIAPGGDVERARGSICLRHGDDGRCAHQHSAIGYEGRGPRMQHPEPCIGSHGANDVRGHKRQVCSQRAHAGAHCGGC